MKNDIKELINIWKDGQIPSGNMIWIGFILLVFTIPAMIWRFIIGFLMIVLGVLKFFKPRSHVYTVQKSLGRQEKCPVCGTELTYYNHFAYEEEEGTSYVKCFCGYDSREEMEV